MPRERKPQRYQLKWEFVLQNPSNYDCVRGRIQEFINSLDQQVSIASDLLTIEKVKEDTR